LEFLVPLFLVRYRYTDDEQAQALVRPTHREYLRGLGDALVGSGPTADNGAALVFQAETVDEVKAFIDYDPFLGGGFIAEWTVVEWTVLMGRWADPAQRI
jgi:uncharacterized protein YciI